MESIRIGGVNKYESVFVSTQGHNVWINLQVRGGSAYTNITPLEAQRMIKALEAAIKDVEQYEAKEEARLDAMYEASYGDE
jgi:hypothetical protein